MMYRPVPRPLPPPRPKRSPIPFLVVVSVLLAYVAYALLRPLPAAAVKLTPPVIPAQVSVPLPWPSFGQSAYGIEGYGVLGTHGDQTPTGTASTAKVLTALAVLQQKPLNLGDQGPAITITDEDVNRYYDYAAKDGSVLPVATGEQISEYQALEAMMLPSANNIADTLAAWAFGSVDAYTTYANQLAAKLGMHDTHIADASGFSPDTTSTASDLVKLAEAAYAQPVIADIANQKTAEIPNVGTVYNVNALLGQSGIVGIKTGNTDQDPGAFLSAARVIIDGKLVTVFTATMNGPDLMQAMGSAVPLIQSTAQNFKNVTITKAGQTIGTATTSWGASAPIVADKDISVLVWKGTALAPTVTAKSLSGAAKAGTTAGTLTLKFHDQTMQSTLKLSRSLAKPTPTWRLTHPVN